MKSLVQAFFVLAILGMANCLFGQANLVASYLPVAPCATQPVLLSLTDLNGIVVSGNSNPRWNFGDGSPSGYGFNVSHNYAPGTYQARAIVVDSFVGVIDTAYIVFTVDVGCQPTDLFNGTKYYDLNNNGMQDVGEAGVPFSPISIPNLGRTLTTNGNGDFSIPLPAGTHTISTNTRPYYSVSQPSSGSYSVTSTGTGQVTNNFDFGWAPTPNQQDLIVNYYSNPLVPGFGRHCHVYLTNYGTQTMSGSIEIVIDPLLTVTAGPPGYSFSGGILSIPFASLSPNQLLNSWFGVTVSTSAVIGDTIDFLVTALPVVGDLVPANNYDTTSVEVVASWDPNDKTSVATGMGPNGEINAGDELTYTIRFQNEGNFPATFIYIRDTLDPNLDWSSFRIVSASHAMTHTQNSDQIQFYFDQIHLVPKSQDEAASQGFVRYSIKAKNSLAPGDEIRNTASIYFDFNPAVVTNTTLNSVWIPTTLQEELVPVSLELFPNPVLDHATLRFDALGEVWNLTVTDVNGRTVWSKAGERSGEIRIDRKDLPAGTYLFQLVSDSGRTAVGKIIAQ